MANKMVSQASTPTKSTKSKVAPAAPKPRKLAGLNEDRYYRAEDAMRDLARVQTHQSDKQLMSDVAKVAQHKAKEAAELAAALAGKTKKG